MILLENQTFGGVFNEWRNKRVQKLVSIFGKSWFKDKKILELGCGFGNVGLYFESLGADVTFSDARQECLNEVLKKNPSAKTILINQERNWESKQKYDLIIHWGVLYHLNNWQQDLKCALKNTHFLCLESAVNKFVNDVEFKIKNYIESNKIYTAFEQTGTLPSVSLIEKQFSNYKSVRFEDSDLNSQKNFNYTIIPKDIFEGNIFEINDWDDERVFGERKFWLVNTQKLKNAIQ